MEYNFLEIKFKLKQKYQENILQYCEGLDVIPSIPKLKGLGYTENECNKLYKLFDIEHMKYILRIGIEDNELSEDEINEIRESITEAIEVYDSM